MAVILRFNEVSKCFRGPSRERRATLDKASFEVGRGELAGVFGPSGVGKTTLLRIAAGMLQPDAGWVSYKDARLDQLPASELQRLRRQEISCMWSSQQWQERLTVLDHVALPLRLDGRDRQIARERAEEALLVCAAEHCQSMELRELSDGERQRIAFARALVCEPKLVLADAPAANLSLPEREKIMRLLALMARDAQVAVLVTSSDAEPLAHADQLLHLREDGKLFASDTSDTQGQIFSFPSLIDRQRAADA